MYLPHPVSKKHPQMELIDRAAQFASFAALTGHEDVMKETARRTDERLELDETQKEVLNQRLQLLQTHIAEEPLVTIEYFIPDERKCGGEYVIITDNVVKIDTTKRELVLSSGKHIAMEDLYEIDSELFWKYETLVDKGDVE